MITTASECTGNRLPAVNNVSSSSNPASETKKPELHIDTMPMKKKNDKHNETRYKFKAINKVDAIDMHFSLHQL